MLEKFVTLLVSNRGTYAKIKQPENMVDIVVTLLVLNRGTDFRL